MSWLCLVPELAVVVLDVWVTGARHGVHTTSAEEVGRGAEASAAAAAAPCGSVSPEPGSGPTGAASTADFPPTGVFR